MNLDTLARELVRCTTGTDPMLAEAALLIATLEYPRLNPQPYLARLDELGAAARRRLVAVAREAPRARLEVLSRYLSEEEHFTGTGVRFDDPRHSCLNQVLDRRTGLPITLGIAYLEVARRAGIRVDGVNFPGRFLVRCAEPSIPRDDEVIIVDPFRGGALLSEVDCRQLLDEYVGDETPFNRTLLAPASAWQILVRVLLNLKRLYVRLRSFPHARDVTELLLTLNPATVNELRDRGLLAYHLQDFSGALRDLEAYLQITSRSEAPAEGRHEEHAQIWEHIKTLRRRVASLN